MPFDPIEKIRVKEYLKKNGWKSLLEISVIEKKKKRLQLLQKELDKTHEKSIKSHAEKLSENSDV